jgi:hypothetical protein
MILYQFCSLPHLTVLEFLLQVLAPLPIGFAVFMVHLATIPVTGTGINPARSLGAAVIYNKDKTWDDQVCSNVNSCGSFGTCPCTAYVLIMTT